MDDIAIELKDLEHVFSDASAEPIKLSYGLLKFVTKNFSNEIGHGRFGGVHMGYLGNGKVAVRELSNLHDKQFLYVITCLEKAKHKNIVRFLGYCSETQEELVEIDGRNVMKEVQKKLLCFEYVPNGNIRHYLQQDKSHGDDWPARYQIIRGICHGLHCLHDKQISHLDLKPENVMFDAQMKPKITDFGLSRFLDQGQSKISTHHIPETLQYPVPDIIFEGETSFTSQIYALGSIIMELLAGDNMLNPENWDEFIDEDCLRAYKCSVIARSCMDPEEHKRPTIHEIIRGLDEVESMINRVPPPKLDLRIYIGTTFAVMAAYALLLMISIRYIKVVVIPAIIIVFIGALWVKGRLQHRNKRKMMLGGGSGKGMWLMRMVPLSYCLQLIQLGCAQATNGQQSGSFVLSHFLLFFSSALGALAVMMAALPIGTARGFVQAKRALHMTFTVILAIAVHTMATEWVEEDMLLICMPGLIAALVGFTVNLDHGGCTVSVNKVTSRKSAVIVLTAAVTLVAYMFAYENEIVLANYWYRRILCSCTLSGFLSCFNVYMILQWWPEISLLFQPSRITDRAMELIQLLKLSAMICFGISAMLLFTGFLLNLSIF